MRSHSSLTSTKTSHKLLPLALSTLITFGPLIYLANHSIKSDKKSPIQQVVEMRLLDDLIKPIPLPKQPVQQVVPNAVLLPSSVFEPLGNIRIENSITQAPMPPEVAEPKTLNLPDCLKNDYGLGLFNVVPLIYDIAKDRCH